MSPYTPRPSVSRTAVRADPLHRGLGVASIVFMVVAAAAPLAVVAATTPIIISASESVAIPVFFLAAAAILVLFAVGFTVMSKYVTNAGAFFSYIQAGLGRVQGLGAATLAICSYAGLLLATTSYIGVATSNVVAHYLDIDIVWWAFSFAALVIVGLLGFRDIELSSKVLGVVLVLETAVVLALDTAILIRGGTEGLSLEPLSMTQAVSGQPGLGLMFAFFAFFGFEATAVFRSEAKDPDRTIPRATYIAVVFIGVFYAISGYAVVSGVGTAVAVQRAGDDPENLVLGLASSYVGVVLSDAMQLLLVTSLFACILSFHNVVTRYTYTLGAAGLLPPRLALVNARYGAPSTASFAVSAASFAAMLLIVVSGIDPVSESYTWLSGAATLGLVSLMTLASVAVIVFFRTHDHDKRLWPTLVAPVLAIAGLAIVLVLVVGNFTALISDPVAAWTVAGVVVLSYVAGLVLALRLRRGNRQAYDALLEE